MGVDKLVKMLVLFVGRFNFDFGLFIVGFFLIVVEVFVFVFEFVRGMVEDFIMIEVLVGGYIVGWF